MNLSQNRNALLACIALAVLYLLTAVAIQFAQALGIVQLFLPLLLLLSAVLLLFFEKPWNPNRILAALVSFIMILVAEEVGVRTGKVFGSLEFGDGMGLKFLRTPVVLPILWMALIYGCGMLVIQAGIGRPWKELTGAAIITFIAYLMQPAAEKLDWWVWQDGIVPTLNFVAWFYISFALLWIYFRQAAGVRNPVAVPFVTIVSFFVAVLNILWFVIG